MTKHMRTTVRLPDNLLLDLKREAARRGGTVTALLEQGARLVLEKEQVPARKRVEVPSFDGGDILPGVNIDSNAELLDIMDGWH